MGTSTWKDYIPLAIIVGLILLTSLVLSFRDLQIGNFSTTMALSYFMIGFFIVFAGFKLIDLKGFAEGYSTYDLLARRVFVYGYVYPFIELSFGLAMILYPTSQPLLAEMGVMGFSGLGVSIKLMKREKFQCVCLGTFLKVPLTKITVLEDFGMVALALVMLFIWPSRALYRNHFHQFSFCFQNKVGGNDISSMLKLSPRLVQAGRWKVCSKGHCRPATPARAYLLKWMHVEKFPNIRMDDYAVATCRHKRLKVSYGPALRV